MVTTQIPRDFIEFLKSCVAHDVKFLLIGGYALGALGYVRNTVDIDVWIEAVPENRLRAVEAIRAFGFPRAEANLLDDPSVVVRMGVAPLRIEILQTISGVSFDECWPNRFYFAEGDLRVPVISLGDLRKNKRASGRPKDLADLARLPKEST